MVELGKALTTVLAERTAGMGSAAGLLHAWDQHMRTPSRASELLSASKIASLNVRSVGQ